MTDQNEQIVDKPMVSGTGRITVIPPVSDEEIENNKE